MSTSKGSHKQTNVLVFRAAGGREERVGRAGSQVWHYHATMVMMTMMMVVMRMMSIMMVVIIMATMVIIILVISSSWECDNVMLMPTKSALWMTRKTLMKGAQLLNCLTAQGQPLSFQSELGKVILTCLLEREFDSQSWYKNHKKMFLAHKSQTWLWWRNVRWNMEMAGVSCKSMSRALPPTSKINQYI